MIRGGFSCGLGWARADGAGNAAGEMPKKQNKTRFRFVCTNLRKSERARERERGRCTLQKLLCSEMGLQPLPTLEASAIILSPHCIHPAHSGTAAKSESWHSFPGSAEQSRHPSLNRR